MEALRSLTVDQSTCHLRASSVAFLNPYLVRDYHKQYYVPHNLSLIITGKMSKGTPSILSVLQEQVEPSILAHGQNHGPKTCRLEATLLRNSERQPTTDCEVSSRDSDLPREG
jgi:Zn-dependent M16 (insulinase) family peptidase